MTNSAWINISSIIINIFIAIWHISVAKKQNNIALFHEKKEHYKKYKKIIDKFGELEKSSEENFQNICDEIQDQLRDCAEEAKFLFNNEIANLENEISEKFSNCILGHYDSDSKKNEIYNNIVRTKYQQCRKKIEIELKSLL